MDVVFDRVAGLDVGKASVMVCVRACASRARAGPGPHLRSTLHEDPPDLAYVSTGTIPVWLLGARLARAPVLCHVHEAEEGHHRLVSLALAAPLALADRVVANSRAAAEPTARRHTPGEPWELVLVGRLSSRKGIDVALNTVAPMAEGQDVHLSVCGMHLPGYEWYEQDLRDRVGRPDVAGHVELLGYVHPTRDLLDAADVVLVPSRTEPFGNTAVGGLPARRAVGASGVQGLSESSPTTTPASWSLPATPAHSPARRAPARRPGPALEALRAGVRRCGAALQHRPLRRGAATRARRCCASRPRRRFTRQVDRTMHRFG